MSTSSFSTLAEKLVGVFEKRNLQKEGDTITVNALISKVASFYEKFRTAMDYGSEETIPRRAIERMLKRMLILEQEPKILAQNLVRELIWAGYFPNASVPQELINQIANAIELHFKLRNSASAGPEISADDVANFIMQILSCEILYILLPNRQKDSVANFMFNILRESVKLEGEPEETRDIQVFLAIRKNFSKDDLAFLRYKLFTQIFGRLNDSNFSQIEQNFESGYGEIKKQLLFPKKERIVSHVKRITPPFLILYEILSEEKENIRRLAADNEQFRIRVFSVCERKYQTIKRKVRTAIIRSFIFILFTKAITALAIEGTFESIFLGKILWSSIALNTIIPPAIMAGVGFAIRTPGVKNTEAIYADIQKLLFIENPSIAKLLVLKKSEGKPTAKDYMFSIFWLFSIALTFGIIWFLLGELHFNILSKGIFVFFVAIISFLSYRIYQTANGYTVLRNPNIFTPLFDFFFVPIIRVGRSLTEGITQINFLLLTIDFIIESPFKGVIGFFEQWFVYVATKREELE
ncbi:MAG: hypothetical protein A2798_03940 [Candidatus Levybacteria bacterium RIFCSPHIGHO2_01_FULL_37_17]|nr:MAG: hypothetical protein A2798_03940 [Candidatus Levybacteria bacterium RIFCSPHIGHO2_01_FULL_37_17]OGH36619.1 MAG: hypothetical protein A2959_03995 [Candidatus Levybacteria bacterium RIFCSPLOWO2_01_FULL_38_23]